MKIDWIAPDNKGSALTAYVVKIRSMDGVTFLESLAYCDGSSASVIAATECYIPIG